MGGRKKEDACNKEQIELQGILKKSLDAGLSREAPELSEELIQKTRKAISEDENTADKRRNLIGRTVRRISMTAACLLVLTGAFLYIRINQAPHSAQDNGTGTGQGENAAASLEEKEAVPKEEGMLSSESMDTAPQKGASLQKNGTGAEVAITEPAAIERLRDILENTTVPTPEANLQEDEALKKDGSVEWVYRLNFRTENGEEEVEIMAGDERILALDEFYNELLEN